jgi:hypothetical protein
MNDKTIGCNMEMDMEITQDDQAQQQLEHEQQ